MGGIDGRHQVPLLAPAHLHDGSSPRGSPIVTAASSGRWRLMRKALLIAGIALLGWYASFTWLPAIYARGRLSGRIDSRCSYDLMRASIEREAGRLGRQDDRAARS